MKEQGRGVTGSPLWLRMGRFVVAGQIALSLPLLIGSALLIQTLDNLRRADVGFPTERLLMIRANAQTAGYEEPRRQALFERLHARVRATPGVTASAYSAYGMLLGGDSGDEVTVEGYTPKGDSDRGSRYDHIGPGYFATLGVRVLLGRELEERDHANAPRVCVINEAFAKRFFEGRNPIGLHVTQLYGPQRNTYRIVGVVANTRKRGLRGEIEHRFYVPTAQPIDVPETVTFAVRTSGDPAAAVNDVRRAILAEDSNLPIVEARPVTELIEARTARERLLARLAAAFGAVALLLAAIGLYGVLSFNVARRTSELGIRKALGARDGTLIRMILRETSALLLVGVTVGVAIALGALRGLEAMLFGLTPSDPASLGAAILSLTGAALLAAWLPARRASRVDPLAAIRYE